MCEGHRVTFQLGGTVEMKPAWAPVQIVPLPSLPRTEPTSLLHIYVKRAAKY